MKEIDIVGTILKVFKEPKLLGKILIASAILGVIVALAKPKEYTAFVTLAPEVTGMGMSQSLGNIASAVGFDLGGANPSTDAIYPDIYPNVFASNDFVLDLFDIQVTQLNDTTPRRYYDHLVFDKKIPFWSYPSIWIAELLTAPEEGGTATINPFKLSKTQDGVCNLIKKNIHCQIDKETNVITINVTDFDPQVAAIMADTVQVRLQQYITVYRTKKARNDLEFAQTIFDEAYADYIVAQKAYNRYAEANTDVIIPSYKSQLEDLENEMQLKYNLYNQAATQLQTAKTKVQERTPAFTIVQNSTVPIRASSTPRSVIVILFMFLGFMADAIWVVFGRALVAKLRKK